MKINTCPYCAEFLSRRLANQDEFICTGCLSSFDIDDLVRFER